MKNRYIQIFSCLIALLSFATFPACELDDEINFVKGVTISVTTNPISDIGSTYAVVGGVVKATSNNTVITKRGVVYSTSPNPTIESDNDVSGGTGLGSFGCNLVDLLDETKYYVRAYAINRYGKVLYGEEKSFTTNRATYENGHEYIDLGLSVKWATMNVGASNVEDYGRYYAWGETSTKSTHSWSNYKWCNGSKTTLTKYNTDSSYGTVDNKTQLDLSDDAARANWGGAWRMPTDAEWTELIEQCTWTWMTHKGVECYKVKSKNGNFIFLPAAGYGGDGAPYGVGSNGHYWSSSLNAKYSYTYCARGVYFYSGSVHGNYNNRYCGQSVRPVLGENESVQTTAPAVTTAVVTQITETSAVVGGNVTSDGNASVTERGVVYSTNPNPVITNLNNTIRPCGSGTGEFTYTITGLQSGTTYYVRAYAKNDVGTAYGEEMSFTTKVQATPEYVDLGLSVKWATFNVGANTPEEYGDYFAWGETEPKATYSWSTYKWCNGSETTLTKYNTDSSYGTVDNKTQLDLSDDAARANWGGDWRMPTDAEWTELREQCTWTWTTQNGVNGYKVTSKSNGNSIFLPAAGDRLNSDLHYAGSYGYYWSSQLKSDYPERAWCVHFGSSKVYRSEYSRILGQSVRPVLGENESVQTTAPAVTTAVVTQITETSAVVGGNVTSDGNAGVPERGVVYSTNPNPVITDLNNTIRPCGSGTGEFTYTITGLQTGTKYYIRAYAKNDVGTAYGEEVSFTTKVQATPEYVDLGLSVKWATFNVGASKPEDYGSYFAWGETEPKETYNWGTYKWCNGSSSTLTKYNTSSSRGTVDNKTTLELNDDAARANLGGSWRMPTDAEMTELRTNCTWTWTTENGVNGYKVTSKSNGNSIFLPAAGCRLNSDLHDAGSYGRYWSSSLRTGDSSRAWYVSFLTSGVYWIDSGRYEGLSVRAVLGENESVQTTAPTVTTSAVTQITETSAVAGGNVTSDGNASVTERGVCIATVSNPTTANTKITAGSGTGTFNCNLTNLQPNTKYYVRAYAINSKGTAYGSQVSFTTNGQPTPEYVDLGLSVKWATFNVGASTPEEYGDYFAWGETEPKEVYNMSTYKWCNGSETTLTKYNTKSSNGTVDNKTQLDLSDDAARANWGGAWRMPTYAEWRELCEQCTWTWTAQNGVNGYKVTSTKSGYTNNSIFLPAAGYRTFSSLSNAGSDGFYWSSSLITNTPYCSWGAWLRSSDVASGYYGYRSEGLSVRPVHQ